jgi:cAMP-dependent protein kinase regulator
MERQQYLETTIRPLMENLVFQIVSERPENPASYMIDWLQKTGGYTSNNLSKDEKKELENLRLNILDYRGREGDMDDEEVIISDDDDEEEYKHNELLEDKKKVLKGKGKRTGVSAEAYGKFNKKGNFKPIFIKKNENQINRIKSRIMQSIIFGMIDEKDINIVIGAMDERNCPGGEVIIKQGEPADCLYVVELGELDCYKKFPDGEEKKVKEYFEGDSFGELALLYNSNRAATVIARTKCVLWALDRETFNHIVKDASINKRERYEGFLKSVEALKGIDPYEMTQVCDALKQCSYKEGDYVIKEVTIIITPIG